MVRPEVFYSPLLIYARSIRAGGPDVQKEEVTSQATPLAEDFLKTLQGDLSTAFGTGFGPNQMEAGTALRQFINALQGGRGGPGFAGVGETPTVDRGGLERLITGLEESSRLRTGRSAADLREQGGITGTRFGSSLAQGEALLRAESGASLDQLIGGLQERGREFDVGLLEGARKFDVGTREGARQFDIGALLQSIAQLFGQGQTSLDFLRQVTGQGIFPEEIIVSPGVGQQLLAGGISGGAKIAAAAVGAG